VRTNVSRKDYAWFVELVYDPRGAARSNDLQTRGAWGVTVVGTSCEELQRHVNMWLLHPFTALVRAHHFAFLVVTPWGYKASGRPCGNLCLLARTPVASSSPSLGLKRKRGREIDLETGEKLLSLQGATSPSLLNNGRAGLDPIGGYAGTPTGPC
jgi:hypothetical protein